jgi:thiol-disulfide isomerase/thioredoxin/ribosomal protein S8
MLFYASKIDGSSSINYLDVLFLTENIDTISHINSLRYGATQTKKVVDAICYNDSMVVSIWSEERDDQSHYYTQNIFIDGQMGIIGADTLAPNITEINVLSNKKLQILFNEPLFIDSAQQFSSYSINNDTNIVIEYVELLHPKELIICAQEIKEGSNTLYMKNVTDLLLNVNPLDSVNFQFIPDTVYPEISTLKPVANDKIVIRFNEPIAEKLITDPANYELNSGSVVEVKIITDQQILLYTTLLVEQDYQIKVLQYSDNMENTVENEVHNFSFVNNSSNLVYYEEDFSNGIPDTFDLYDIDQNTPISELSSFSQAWIAVEQNDGNRVVASTSAYEPAAQADDWMITQKIAVKKSAWLCWDAKALDSEVPDGYQIWASTKGNNIEEFTIKVFEIGEEHYAWRYRSLDLSEFGFGDDTVFIAFRNNSNNRYVLNIDNIELYSPQTTDVAVKNTNMPINAVSAGLAPIDFIVENRGVSTLESLKLNYQFNGGAVKTNFVDSLSIPLGETLQLYHTDKLQLPTETGTYKLQLWTSEPNGLTDEILNNDTLTLMVNIDENYPKRMVVLEHFTNTGCSPCALYNPYLETLLAENNNADNVMHITYHVNWPGANDPFYLANPDDVLARKDYYGISGVPSVAVNGDKEVYSPHLITQNILDQESLEPGLLQIEGSAKFAKNTLDLAIDINMSNLINFNAKSPAAFIVMAQDYDFEETPGTNGETYFPGVMLEIMPNNTGEVLTNLDSLAINNLKFNYTLPDDIALEKAFLGVFIQDTATSQVYMATKISMLEVGIADAQINNVSVYPNPANNHINVKANATINTVKVIDIAGKISMQINSDTQSVTVNLAELENGYYIVIVETNKGISTHRIVVE